MFEKFLSRGNLSVGRLHALVLLSEHGNLIKAAKGDASTQSRYSRALADLGKFFKIPLTQRDGQSIKLTAAGEELARLVKTQFRALEEFQSRTTESIDEIGIGAGDSLIQWLLVPALGALRRPGKKQTVKIENLRTKNLVKRLQDQEIDLGLLRSNAVPKGLKHTKIGVIKYVIVVPRRFSLRQLTVESVLNTCPLAAIGGEGELFNNLLSLAQSSKATFKPELICDTVSQCLAAVRTGSFAAVLPVPSLENAGDMDCDIVDEKILAELDRPISLVWNQRNLDGMGGALERFKTDLATALVEEAKNRGI